MSNSIIITTDLGTFRAFKVAKDRNSTSPSLEPLDSFETIYGDDRISRRVSDQAGQFGKGSTSSAAINDGANGERHNIHLEDQRRSMALIANRMEELLNDAEVDNCYFAASSEVNGAILERLSPGARGKIGANLSCNLVNAKKEELVERFFR